MKKIFALFVAVLVMASCTDPFDATAIWDKLNELENKNEDIENDVNGSGSTNNDTDIPDEVTNNKIYYTTADGKKLFPNNTEPAALGAILVSNIYENGVGVLTFDDDITSIVNCEFDGCTSLTSIIIPNSVTSIGYEAFSDCTGLTSVTIGNSVTSIGSSAFKYCSGLTSITIGNSVTSIGHSAFNGCTGLTSITIGNSVTSIGNMAFCKCSGLTSVTIPNSVTSIGSSAFEYCSGLTSITIGNSVTSIGHSAFEYCIGLTSITIPNSVTSIEEYAFEDCDGLKEVHITDLDAWKNISFGNYYANPLYYGAKLYLNGVEVTEY